ncbi:hypothetical protein M6D93_10640 [Jatrophihabitans telluris]|uniref:DNA-(apurinic or apyrimidinic site) lyase n=1 Tax=Jatrophihabitans telluris TaxID=2038343 RepID=A0ABY4QSH6_9ACTN|nr:DNA-formamidopyrimidine glycosylase family protein [Jatrophihabitans telluris]UQX86764.1 hypothetical protein M6D93_10640 [Jatrophihabitans telluris]
MPELPEVETARLALDKAALNRRIVDVDDLDSYVCRPHSPGDIRSALVGRRLESAHRRGKSLWCETSGVGRSRHAGPTLGIHLGMAGRLFIDSTDGELVEGGDPIVTRRSSTPNPAWDRFTVHFADGGTLRLFDKRRLGRVRLDPDLSQLGPDALDIAAADFDRAIARGSAPIKARLLDQSALAGVGNLLADEVLWQAKVSPQRPVSALTAAERRRLYRALRAGVAAAVEKGGVHTGRIIPHRRKGDHCPRCHTEMTRATVGGRTTWWCPKEQVA